MPYIPQPYSGHDALRVILKQYADDVTAQMADLLNETDAMDLMHADYDEENMLDLAERYFGEAQAFRDGVRAYLESK